MIQHTSNKNHKRKQGNTFALSNHIIFYHIISYHIISNHIISYHIILYHIKSYHIISKYISYILNHSSFIIQLPSSETEVTFIDILFLPTLSPTEVDVIDFCLSWRFCRFSCCVFVSLMLLPFFVVDSFASFLVNLMLLTFVFVDRAPPKRVAIEVRRSRNHSAATHKDGVTGEADRIGGCWTTCGVTRGVALWTTLGATRFVACIL